MRRLHAVPVSRDPLALLAPLRRALHGEGPALVPVTGDIPPALGGMLAPGEDDPDDPTAVMIATSGSTGQPKGVLLSAGALRASATATHARLGGPGRWLVATPVRYIGGLQVLVRSILANHVPGCVDLSNGFRPELFAAAARSVLSGEGPCYTAIVPTQLIRLLDADGDGLASLRSFDAVIVGAAATSDALRARAVDAGIRMVAAYGMSETASGCVYDGRALDGVRVRLSGGAIEISGAVLARGYRGDPAATARAFAGGWFRTGDLGAFDRDGRLAVLGRADEVINTGGVKVAPVLVERVLCAVAGVAEACVVGVPDPLWGQAVVAAIVTEVGTVTVDEQRLAEAVRTDAGRFAVPKRFVVLDELPMRGPGKPDRAALRELLAGRDHRQS